MVEKKERTWYYRSSEATILKNRLAKIGQTCYNEYVLLPTARMGGFLGVKSLRGKEKKVSRLDTMAARILEDIPEFVELVPPTEQSEGLYRRIRHIQKTGECCGIPMTIQQLKDVIRLASRESVKKPLHFLCVVLDRVHVEKTLQNAARGQKIDVRVRDIARYVKLEAEWQIRYLSDLILGKYSMDDLMVACEIATRKKHPDRYLIGMFRRGFVNPCRRKARVV